MNTVKNKRMHYITKSILATVFLVLSFAFTGPLIDAPTSTKKTAPPGEITFIGTTKYEKVMSFQEWAITKAEIPSGNIEDLHVEVEIKVKSIFNENKVMVRHLKNKEHWFNTKKFPLATVVIDKASKNDDGTYSSNANITIKGVSQEVPVQFTISEAAPYTVEGTATLNRKNFDLLEGGPKDIVPVSFKATIPQNL